jgi:hypothetical protein
MLVSEEHRMTRDTRTGNTPSTSCQLNYNTLTGFQVPYVIHMEHELFPLPLSDGQYDRLPVIDNRLPNVAVEDGHRLIQDTRVSKKITVHETY